MGSATLSIPGCRVVTGRQAVNPWIVAVTVTLATFMELLDTAIANVSLPHIAGGLAVSYDESSWVLTSYLVSNAVVLPLSAWLSRVFGCKRYYMLCAVLFTLSSLLCGLAPTLGLLIVFRVLQGVGGGGLAPVWRRSRRKSGPRRRRKPGVRWEDLPPIDIVLISHDHYDHLDLPTLRRLAVDRHPAFIVPLGLARLLAAANIGPVHELDWGQSLYLPNVVVHCVPALHFSARGILDRNKTLWCGYVIESQNRLVYFAGDTGSDLVSLEFENSCHPLGRRWRRRWKSGPGTESRWAIQETGNAATAVFAHGSKDNFARSSPKTRRMADIPRIWWRSRPCLQSDHLLIFDQRMGQGKSCNQRDEKYVRKAPGRLKPAQ